MATQSSASWFGRPGDSAASEQTPVAALNQILLVEDNDLDRDVLCRRLRQQGYLVDQAHDGAEGLQKLRAGHYDLVLLDILMPGMDGFDVLRQVRRLHSLDELPIIMVTADETNEFIIRAFSLGANDYLTKRMPPRVALARIATHLNLHQIAAANRDFLNTTSRDFRKPLASLNHLLETLLTAYPVGTEVDQNLQETLRSSLETVAWIQTTLKRVQDLYGIENRRIQLRSGHVDLNHLARQVVESNAHYAGQKAHTLVLDLDEQLPSVEADPKRLVQVMDNLVGNAIKFSPRQISSTVRTRFENHNVVFEVEDQGPGLTIHDLERVFRGRYNQLSNLPTGGETSIGLGLSICKHLIEMQGGEIGVHNNRNGRGATFWFRLPVRPAT